MEENEKVNVQKVELPITLYLLIFLQIVVTGITGIFVANLLNIFKMMLALMYGAI